ncbi:unnamed protein product [Pieris macdunnoughi]|uniref:Uncharacterized protein n=1 Tax=Pieris macdunnoughi TaxID=345717 RepID=A0A821XW40_9NEOP|nr:unnamed protein product [Pieris macdunnoughi]
MTRLDLLIASIFISTAFIAVYGYPGSILHRDARSPYYGGFGFHPPPPFPFFRTNNWSGITKSADGNTNGVYSGAAASATNTASATGQALSLASADCDDDDSVQSTGISGKLIAGFGDGHRGDHSGGFGGQFSAHKEARYSFQSGGGKFEAEGSGLNGQSGTGSHEQLNLGASSSANGNIGAADLSKGNGLYSSSHDSAQAGGKLTGGDQSGGFSSSSAHSSSFGSVKGNGQQQVELVSGGIHSEKDDQEQSNLDTQADFNAESGQKNTERFTQNEEESHEHSHQQYGIPNQQGDGLSQQGSVLSQQTLTSSYGQQNKVGGAFGQQNNQLKEQVGLNGGNGQQTVQSGYGQQKVLTGVGHQQYKGAFGQSQGQVGFDQHVHQGGFNKHQAQASFSQKEQNQGAFGQSQGQVGFGQHVHQGGQGGFNKQQGQASLSQEEQLKQHNLQGGNSASSQASSYAHVRGFGYGRGFSGYGHDHSHSNGFNSKYQANQDLQQQQSGPELTSGNSESQSAGSSSIGGALNLASQGLEAAQKAGCSTCAGNGGYAFSNAKSHSGSAISIAFGG